MKTRRRRLLAVLGTVSVAALSGCSNDAEDTQEGESPTEDEGDTDDDQNEQQDSSPPSQQAAKLAPDDGNQADRFGWSVAVPDDGSTAIVGAPTDEDPNGEQAGSAYVFAESGGDWQQQAKLAADDGNRGDGFGSLVAVSDDGNTAIIGARQDDDPNGEGAGSAYVFAESGGDWQQQAKLAPDDGDQGDRFGWSVAVLDGGSTAIIGAPNDETTNGEQAGSAYVFAESGGDWQQQAKLAPDDGNERDFFGTAVAVSDDGNTAIIGARQGKNTAGENAGSAYVFAESDGDWLQQAKLVADDGDGSPSDFFGTAVAVSDDGSTAVIGAREDEDPNGEDAGSAYVFAESDGDWQQQVKLAPEAGTEQDIFGTAVAVSGGGSTLIIGAPNDEDPNGEQAGSAYVFAESSGNWEQETKLAPEDGDQGDGFGNSIAVSDAGGTAVIGAFRDDDPNGEQGGSAYLFE